MISVVVPLYNGKNYIENTLQDILNNTERNIEVLVIDDGSRDTGAELVKKMADKDARLRYFWKENGGIASARNYGLERAKGEYICFLDQDDFVRPDMFAVMREDIENTQADMVKANATQSVNGIEESEETKRSQIVLKNGTETYNHYLQSLVMCGRAPHPECEVSVSIWSCLFRTEFLKENGIRFESFCDYEDDRIVCIKAFKKAGTVCLESRTVYCWRVHAQSESHNRIVHDRYIENFYEKYCKLNHFFHNAVADTGLTEQETDIFSREMQKRAILWNLSNETGRGIEGRDLRESEQIVKAVVQAERKKGLYKGMITHPLSTTGYGVFGGKKMYHLIREGFLMFMLLHHMEGAAVHINKKFLHGRWHL